MRQYVYGPDCNGDDGLGRPSLVCVTKRDISRLPTWPSAHKGLRLLHPSGRYRGRWAGHGDTSSRVDNGDGITATGGRGLVKLEGRLLTLVDRRKIGRVEREAWGDGGGLLRRRALRRVACQGGALRGGTVDGDQL